MTTTEDLRKYLDAHGIDGPPTGPGWHVVSLISEATTAFVLAQGGRDRLMFILGMEHGRHFLFPAEIRKHAPLTLAAPAGRDLDAEVVAGVKAFRQDFGRIAGKAST